MDQLKVLYRHRFWISCGLITVCVLVVWFLATASLRSEISRDRKKWEGGFSAAEQIKQVGVQTESRQVFHTNEDVLKFTNDQISRLSKKVEEAWDIQWNHQKGVFTWSESDLGADFVAKVQELRPIESKLSFPLESEPLDDELRNRYRNYIETALPRLVERVNAEWAPGTGSAGLMSEGGSGLAMPFAPGGPGLGSFSPDRGDPRLGKPKKTHLVQWNASNQSLLQQKIVGPENHKPTTLDILYAQENLWVLGAVIDIIADVNTGADDPSNASIKMIDHILIGSDAQSPRGRITMVASAASTTGDQPAIPGIPGVPGVSSADGADGKVPGAAPYPGPGALPAGGGDPFDGGAGGNPGFPIPGNDAGATPGYPGPGADAGVPGYPGPGAGPTPGVGDAIGGTGPPGLAGASLDPAHYRYVDNNYQPLTAQKLREGLESNAPENAYLRVAKRMPLIVGLQMDQRKLSKLLSAFGNSPFSIEIRQVRISRHKSEAGTSAPGAGYPGPGASGPAPVGPAPIPGVSGAEDGETATRGQVVSSNDVPIEVYGIVYIYNPVAKEILNIKEDGEASPPDDTATASGATTPVPAS